MLIKILQLIWNIHFNLVNKYLLQNIQFESQLYATLMLYDNNYYNNLLLLGVSENFYHSNHNRSPVSENNIKDGVSSLN